MSYLLIPSEHPGSKPGSPDPSRPFAKLLIKEMGEIAESILNGAAPNIRDMGREAHLLFLLSDLGRIAHDTMGKHDLEPQYHPLPDRQALVRMVAMCVEWIETLDAQKDKKAEKDGGSNEPDHAIAKVGEASDTATGADDAAEPPAQPDRIRDLEENVERLEQRMTGIFTAANGASDFQEFARMMWEARDR